MAQPQLNPYAPEPRQTRTELTLGRIARAWASQPRGARFVRALTDFLRSCRTPSTARSYSYSVLELFEYLEEAGRSIPLPDQIRRVDAVGYDRWLRERLRGLGRFRLGTDPRRRLDAAIWDIVAGRPGCRIGHIRARLLEESEFTTTTPAHGGYANVLKADVAWRNKGGLGRHLACLVQGHTLTRTPSVEELRRSGVLFVGEQADEQVFRYYAPQLATPPGPARASGIVTRLTALSSLWTFLSRGGENVPGEIEPLLQYNIWTTLLGRAREQAPSHQAARRAETTPDMELFVRLLATTYAAAYGKDAGRAAELAAFSRPVPARAARASFSDLRDRALLLIMLQPGGPRAIELARMRRSHVRGDPGASDPKKRPMLTITGKRGLKRVVPVPPGALDALQQLTHKLRALAAHQLRYHGVSRAEWLLRPDAPLLPAISYWGANAGVPSSRGLSRAGVAMALRRRAARDGIEAGSAALRRIHPHGFRHLFATEAIRSGTPLNVVQAMMGHAPGSVTTLRYMEERAPERLIAEPFRGVRPRPFEAAPPLTPPERPAAEPFREVRPLPSEPARPAARPPTVAKRPTPALPKPELPPVGVVPPKSAIKPVSEPAPVQILAEVIEPEPPEALIGVGAPPVPVVAGAPQYWERRLGRSLSPAEREQLGECEALPTPSAERLCATYRLDWGERGKRERMALTAAELQEAGVEAAARQIELAVLGVEEEGVVTTAGLKRLQQCYAGRSSGVVWWAGHAGRLKPEMAVCSMGQLGDCEAETGLCGRLSELWRRWMLAGGAAPGPAQLAERGPTSACALVGWTTEALTVAAEVEAAVAAKGAQWVPSEAALSETELAEGAERSVYREHDLDAVAAWFERVAWQYRTSRGKLSRGELGSSTRQPRVTGRLPELPEWYGETDPLLSLSRPDRQEALDFIAALVGDYALQDRTPRFRGASRRDLASVIEAMRRYEEEEHIRRDLKARRRAGEVTDEALARARSVADAAAEDADRLIHSVGGRYDFSLKEASTQRVKTRAATGAKREYLSGFYLRMLGELFGAEAATDPLLRLVSEKKKPPLTPYRELLRPDFTLGTITHSPRYAEAFARATGAHSECVARRLCRNLWELWHSGRRGAGAFKRRKELLDLVDAMAAYRVPCPRAQENELRARLGRAEPVAIYERFREAREREIEPVREVEVLEEIFAPIEEEFTEAREAELRYLENPWARPLSYTREAARRLPTALEARWALVTTR